MIGPSRLDNDLRAQWLEHGHWQNQTLDSYIARCAKVSPNEVAVVDGEQHVSYADLDQQINRFAFVLTELGIGAGDVVSWQLPNWLEAIVVHHASIRIGAVSNPIVPIYRHREVGFILKQSGASVFVIPTEFRNFNFREMAADLKPDLPDLNHVVLVDRGNSEDALLDGTEHIFDCLMTASSQCLQSPNDLRSPDDVAVMIYTSGTTSDPKGVLHTHNTLDYENNSIIELFALNESDVVFMPSPLAHITGILYGLQLPFMLGSSVVLQDVWQADAALELIQHHRCSFMIAATPFLHGLTYHSHLDAFDVSSLRTFGCGGADVPPELIRQAEIKLDCLATRVYGSSEFPTLSAGNEHDALDRRAQTDGRPIGAALARVVDEDDKDLPPGTSGDLLVKGPELFVGYLDAALNDQAFTSDGWFRTGDLATLDELGFVTITGRRKDIIVRGGENISAKEIEDLLFEHPAIADVAIVGMPDPVMVERICAFIVLEKDQSVDLDHITSFLRERKLAMQKLPERMETIDSLPMTASGKIQKFKLRDEIKLRMANE